MSVPDAPFYKLSNNPKGDIMIIVKNNGFLKKLKRLYNSMIKTVYIIKNHNRLRRHIKLLKHVYGKAAIWQPVKLSDIKIVRNSIINK